MISVAIEADRDEEGLARALMPVIGAVAEGIVRDAVVAARTATPSIVAVIDALGCDLVTGDRSAAIAAVRGPWVLALPVGGVLEENWWYEARKFIERSDRAGVADAVATFTVSVDGEGVAARWREWRLRSLPAAGAGGLLGRKATLLEGRSFRPQRLRPRLYRP